LKPVLVDWLTRPGGIAERLRAVRSRSGLTGKDLAEQAGWPQSKISKLENGKQRPTADDLRFWTEACGAPEETEELLDLLSEVETVHLDWKRRAARGGTAIQTTMVELVEQSTLIRHFETVFVPGPLLVPEYAHAVLTDLFEFHGLEVRDVDDAVVERQRRQRYLYEPGKRWEFILAESVLRWLIVPPPVMHAQLDRLLTAMGMSNIRLGLLPFGVRLATAPQNKFELYDDQAIVETFVGETVHSGKESETYARAMDRLWDEAVTGDEARQLILRATESLSGG
jgi:transcriptional regulator with XRE-family HTH domain